MDFQDSSAVDGTSSLLTGEDSDATMPLIPTMLVERGPADIFVSDLSMDSGAAHMLEDLKPTELMITPPSTVSISSIAVDESTISSIFSPAQTKLNVPEEDSRSSFDSFKAPLAPDSGALIPEEDSQSSFKAPVTRDVSQEVVVHEEDSQGSVSSQRSTKRRWENIGDKRPNVFLAENLFEYQWPAGGGGEYYMLQEQISEYLGIKSFKRKYPDLQRRQVEMDEKEFLKECGVVTETQCDLGLTALRADEVIDLMVRDYFEKYQEYERVLQEKEKRNISEKHRGYSAPSVEKSKMSEFVKKSMRSAADWNLKFNRKRQEERKACFDLQTYTIHYPIGKRSSKMDTEPSNGSCYPLALIPGQFQDYYRTYTEVELKYLPMNTVIYGPRKLLGPSDLISGSDGSPSDSEDSSCSEGSSSGSTRDGSGDSTAGDTNTGQQSQSGNVTPSLISLPPPRRRRKTPMSKKAMKEAAKLAAAADDSKKGNLSENGGTCRVCHQEKKPLKDGKLDEMIFCSLCRSCGHASCLDFPPEMVATIRTYSWQCMDCKKCMMCLDPYDEDKMMFCDKCDRGYHTFCVGLKNLPAGPWVCASCGSCGVCGATMPGAEGSKAQWFHEYSKPVNGNRELKQTLCLVCSRMKRAR